MGKVIAPKPLGKTERVWQHTVYLGVYALEKTYASLHEAFGDDKNAYDERPGGCSACAGVVIDAEGRLIANSAVLSSALWAVGCGTNPDTRYSRPYLGGQVPRCSKVSA